MLQWYKRGAAYPYPCSFIANHDSSLHCKRLIIRVDSRKVKGGVKRK